ncbi:DHA2 family efflux MFS transporter permease subunit [Sandaracinobacter sp. RS1-74]|uniref:DHA2 family efflux MFS transporter permease subunit n=1 Tax=Sandaracinobacteroides sayramensis TaxID=2913411 RepID=UPI001EDB6473|nr:DHA2 family efflux MFS transporter permease subunit [Sandaracinobacteroides sayramensis]MCG2841576.1 DHA2 family efflux MFS transporter permease subunit [Sandaracinobacteroides sayramensis]
MSAAEAAPGEAPPAAASPSAKPDTASFIAFILMAFGMFMAILDIQIVAASLGEIQAGLSASADEIAWVQTAYLIAEVVMIPLSGFLSRALGIRMLFVLSCAGFTLASLTCALMTSIEGMIAARAFQGFVGGAMIPTVYAAAFLMFGRERQMKVTVAISFIVTLAPTIGPALGGWLTGFMSWHWLFLINLVPGIFITLGVFLLVRLPDKPDHSLLKRIDIPGLIALSLVCGGLVFVLEDGARRQWFEDEAIRNMSAAVVMAAFLLWWRIRHAAEPIISVKPFANLNFAGGAWMGAVLGIGLYGLVYIYPLFLGRVGQLSPEQIGTTVFVTGLFMALGAPLAGFLSSRIDVRLLASIGFLLLAASTALTIGITHEWRFHELFLPQALRGVGLMFCIVSVSVMAFATLPQAEIKDSTGLFTLMRNMGGAAGIAIINTILQVRTNFHQARLAESANPGRAEIAERLENMANMAMARGLADPDNFAVRALAQTIRREALVMAIADAFLILSVIFVVSSLIPLFLRKPGTFADPRPESH